MNLSKSPTSNINLLKNTLLATGGGIIVIASIGVVSIWQTGSNLVKGITTLFKPAITAPQVDISHLIVKQIQGVSELTTTVFVMDAIVPASSRRQFGNWVVGETKLLYLARGEVKAGLNLSQITNQNVTITDNSVEIVLPPPKILDAKIDVTQSEVYDYSRGFFNLGPDVAPELQTQAQRQTLDKVLTTACAQGILSQANERATLTLTQLLQTAGHQNITIKTTEPQHCNE